MAGTYSTMSNGAGESRYPYSLSTVWERVHISPLSMMFVVCFSQMFFSILRRFASIPSVLRGVLVFVSVLS